jgi:hypothetical protein
MASKSTLWVGKSYNGLGRTISAKYIDRNSSVRMQSVHTTCVTDKDGNYYTLRGICLSLNDYGGEDAQFPFVYSFKLNLKEHTTKYKESETKKTPSPETLFLYGLLKEKGLVDSGKEFALTLSFSAFCDTLLPEKIHEVPESFRDVLLASVALVTANEDYIAKLPENPVTPELLESLRGTIEKESSGQSQGGGDYGKFKPAKPALQVISDWLINELKAYGIVATLKDLNPRRLNALCGDDPSKLTAIAEILDSLEYLSMLK